MKRLAATSLLLVLVAGYAVAGTISKPYTFSSGQTISSSQVNSNFDTIYNEFNGSITNANINSGAALDPAKIDDYSADAGEQDNAADPGTAGSESLATTLESELTRLRYSISRLSGFLNAEREAGSGLVGVPWIEPPFLGENLIRNASFGTVSDSGTGLPDGWVVASGVVASATADTATANGLGLQWTVTPTASGSGVSYTLGELRASTKYLVVVRGSENAANGMVLSTTGADAASVYRNFSKTMTAGSTQLTYAFVIKTDATPTDIVLKALCTGGACAGVFTFFGVYEMGTEPLGQDVMHAFGHEIGVDDATSCPTGGADAPTDLGASVYVPPGHVVKITVDGNISCDTTYCNISLDIERGTTNVGEVLASTSTSGQTGFDTVFGLTRVDFTPTTGASNTYTLNCDPVSVASFTLTDMSMYVEVIPLR